MGWWFIFCDDGLSYEPVVVEIGLWDDIAESRNIVSDNQAVVKWPTARMGIHRRTCTRSGRVFF